MEETTVRFLLEAYGDLYDAMLHIERKMFDHLTLFVSLFLGLSSVAIGIHQFTARTDPGSTNRLFPLLVGILYLVLHAVGTFQCRMVQELRIRKMRVIDGLALVRQRFCDEDKTLADYLAMIPHISRRPPPCALAHTTGTRCCSCSR